MEINYRPILKADQLILWDFLYLAIYVSPGQDPPPRELILQPELARYVEDWGRPGDLGVLALYKEIPVGAAWLRLMHGYGFVEEGIPELSIAVLSDYRGKGIGTSILKTLIDSAAPIFEAFSLSVTSENPAVHLYEQLGYQVIKSEGNSKTLLLRIKNDRSDIP